MSDFSQSELANLWVQAGGPATVASLMAAIALAESGGNPDAQNPSSGACGLWQINPPESGCNDPFTNAQIAVRKYNTQGLGAWEAYTNGSYKQFYGNSDSTSLLSTSASCMFAEPLGGVCIDGAVGLGGVGLGIVLMIVGIALMISQTGIASSAVDVAKKTAKAAVEFAIIAAPK